MNVVGFILDKAMKTKVMEVLRKSDGIIIIKLVLGASVVSAINLYTPQIRCTDNKKNAFWVMQKALENKKNIIVSDLNRHVEKDNKEVIELIAVESLERKMK